MYQNLPAYVAWQGHGKQGNHTPRLLANFSPVHIAKCLVISHGQQNACVESIVSACSQAWINRNIKLSKMLIFNQELTSTATSQYITVNRDLFHNSRPGIFAARLILHVFSGKAFMIT